MTLEMMADIASHSSQFVTVSLAFAIQCCVDVPLLETWSECSTVDVDFFVPLWCRTVRSDYLQ